MRRVALMMIALAGCAGLDAGGIDVCGVELEVSPSMPIAGPGELRVTAIVAGATGVPSFSWELSFQGNAVPFQDAQANGSAIMFVGDVPGIYTASVTVDAANGQCSQQLPITVRDPSATDLDVRLHVIPPVGDDVPPTDRRLRISGGGDYAMGPVVLDPGVAVTGLVRGGGVGVPAYLRFAPLGMERAIVEAFASVTGSFSARVLDQTHAVLVIPQSTTYPPQLVSWSPSATTIDLAQGSAITGTVRHGGAPVIGAKVQLAIDGVPSTLATTAGDGTFTVRGVLAPTRPVQVVVTPPAASGLPRLEATAGFDLSQAVTVTYAVTTLRDVAGTTVRRSGAPIASARTTVVGTRSSAGTVVAGVSAPAAGTVRRVVVAAGNGQLPSALVPAWSLDAVVDVPGAPGAPADVAVAAFDVTAAVPATVDAPAMLLRSTHASAAVELSSVRLTLVPTGALALAGSPTSEFTGDDLGALLARFASGGRYDLVWSDPAGRAGQHVVLGITAATVAGNYDLPPPLRITGTLSVTGAPNKIAGASVQILCASCTGVERDRPIAEDVSTTLGGFELVVPDPGTM